MIKAQITVYASLTFAIVISFICTMINSVRMSVIYYETDMASRMSAESVFGGITMNVCQNLIYLL